LNYPQKKIVLRDRLYAGTIESFLLEIRSCPDKVKGLLVVGHNPVISGSAELLIGRTLDTDIEMIPTCGIVAMEFTLSSWQQLREKEGRLLFFAYPKKSDVVI
jgi:phosphohistidine phosphatase